MIPSPHHCAPEERDGGGVVGCRVYRVKGGDIEREDAGAFIQSWDIGDSRHIVELEEFSGKEKVKTESAPKQKEYEDKLDTLGDRNSYNKTDPDATFMRMKEDAMNNGQTKPGYNRKPVHYKL